jgi:Asp-tRNA(Asn)/Glu-tRNA(Gln) amidotransferase A subunit family amidase
VTDEPDDSDGPAVSGVVRSLARRARELADASPEPIGESSATPEPIGESSATPELSADSALPPAEPVERADEYGVYATPVETASASDGPLSDLTVVVKDNVAVRGVTHRLGTAGLAWEPDRDATVVRRLREAGATLRGTTRMDAFAMGATGESCAAGRTENPVADGHVPGGSSSGSAAAVAAGEADAALGTDTGGSVRVPAALCGLVGIKPTYDRVPRTGVADLAPTLDHVGVLAPDAETVTRVLTTVSGGDSRRPESVAAVSLDTVPTVAPETLRLAVPEPFLTAAEPAAADHVETLLDTLRADGVTTEEVAFPEHEHAELVNQLHTLPEFAAGFDAGPPVGVGAHERALRETVAAYPPSALPERLRGLLAIGRGLAYQEPDAYLAAWQFRERVIDRSCALLADADALLTPTTPMPAPTFGAVGDDDDTPYRVSDLLVNTAPFDLTGQPAVTVPAGRVDGRPVGLQLVTPAGADERALAVARAVCDTVA